MPGARPGEGGHYPRLANRRGALVRLCLLLWLPEGGERERAFRTPHPRAGGRGEGRMPDRGFARSEATERLERLPAGCLGTRLRGYHLSVQRARQDAEPPMMVIGVPVAA